MKTLRFITIYPQLIEHYLAWGMMKKGRAKNLLAYDVLDLRDFASPPQHKVDDRPYGGGEGMVMRADVLARAVQQNPTDLILTTSPGGEVFHQQHATELRHILERGRNLTFVCGRFSGIDERFLQTHIHRTYSLGDFVISGGELPCLIIAECLTRMLPGVLGDPASATEDSFGAGLPPGHLRAPVYTRPATFAGLTVPDVLRSGSHADIRLWKEAESAKRTHQHRDTNKTQPLPDTLPET